SSPLYSCLFQNASTNGHLLPPNGTHCPTLPPLKDPNCTTRNCNIPLATTKSNAINLFFTNSVSGGNGALFGLGWLNGNGIVISSKGTTPVFSFSSGVPSRFDTLPHELGHVLGLDHCTNGAGAVYGSLSSVCPNTTVALACAGTSMTLPSPGGCNLMDAGTIRNVAAKSAGTP